MAVVVEMLIAINIKWVWERVVSEVERAQNKAEKSLKMKKAMPVGCISLIKVKRCCDNT